MLSDLKIKALLPRSKPYKVTDGEGLYLLVAANGSKLWRYKYKSAGKEKLLAFGAYPVVTLRDARSKLADAKERLAIGRDPRSTVEIQGPTFQSVANEWFSKFMATKAAATKKAALSRLTRCIYPTLGASPIASITPTQIVTLLSQFESKNQLELAKRLMILIKKVCRYAVGHGYMPTNPALQLVGLLPSPVVNHHASVTDPAIVAKLLKAIDAYTGNAYTVAALRLSPLLFVRPAELRQMRWADIDLAAKEWTIPATDSKMATAHIVPLATQAMAIVGALHASRKANSIYVLSSTNQPLTPLAVRTALVKIGWLDRIKPHGFRAMARTILDEVLNQHIHIVEQQLAHSVRDTNGRAYNRTKHLPQRHIMMQLWADYLQQLRIS